MVVAVLGKFLKPLTMICGPPDTATFKNRYLKETKRGGYLGILSLVCVSPCSDIQALVGLRFK